MLCCDCKKEITMGNSYPIVETNQGQERRCNECHENEIRNYTKSLEIKPAQHYVKYKK